MAMDTDGKVILGGHTTGNWSGTSKGGEDVVATKIDVGDRDTDIWRWQVRRLGTCSEVRLNTGYDALRPCLPRPTNLDPRIL